MKFKNAMKYLNIFLLIIFTHNLLFCNSDNGEQPVYHTPESLERYLQQINLSYPGITYLEQAGSSANGRIISAICISDNPEKSESEPKIRLAGAIHGNENATTEVLIRLIDHIVNKYANGDTYIKSLVDNRYIVIIPMMNPDGVALDTRENANGVDLNRNFSVEWTLEPDHGSAPFSEQESTSIKDYSDLIIFHSSITFHTGAVIVNMPFDYASEHYGTGITPLESSLVEHLALKYTEAGSGGFLKSPGLKNLPYMYKGTINGGDWYIANGTLQDWSYKESGCIDLTVEIIDSRPETNRELDELFELNRDSILAYIDASGIGVYGKVTNGSDSPVAAEITITGGDITTQSDSYGYYHRILLPGTYTIIFSSPGFQPHSEIINIMDETPLPLNITMTAI